MKDSSFHQHDESSPDPLAEGDGVDVDVAEGDGVDVGVCDGVGVGESAQQFSKVYRNRSFSSMRLMSRESGLLLIHVYGFSGA